MIEFYVSSDTEKQKLMDTFCVAPIGKSLMERAKQYHFPPDMAKKMQTSPRIQWDEALEELLETTYLKYKNELETAHSFFHCFWDKNGEAYLSKLDSFFGERFPNYRVLLACYLDVVSNWKECNIVINHDLYKKKMCYTLFTAFFLKWFYLKFLSKYAPLKIKQRCPINKYGDVRNWPLALF